MYIYSYVNYVWIRVWYTNSYLRNFVKNTSKMRFNTISRSNTIFMTAIHVQPVVNKDRAITRTWTVLFNILFLLIATLTINYNQSHLRFECMQQCMFVNLPLSYEALNCFTKAIRRRFSQFAVCSCATDSCTRLLTHLSAENTRRVLPDVEPFSNEHGIAWT